MAKSYNDRLGKLENELQVLLMLHVAAAEEKEDNFCLTKNSADLLNCPKTNCPAFMHDEEEGDEYDEEDEEEEEEAQWLCPNPDKCPILSSDSRNIQVPAERDTPRFLCDLVEQKCEQPDTCPAYKRWSKQEPPPQRDEQQVLDNTLLKCDPECIKKAREERRRSSSAPADAQASTSRQRGFKDCVPNCKGRRNSKPVEKPSEIRVCGAPANQFGDYLQELRKERQNYLDTLEKNKRLQEQLNSYKATAKEADSARRTSMDFTRQTMEKLEAAKMENVELRKELDLLKAEKQNWSDQTRSLQEELVSSRRASSQRSEEDLGKLREAENKVRNLEQRLQEEKRERREEENVLTCAVRDSEARARDAEERVKELEGRVNELEGKLEEAERQRWNLDQEVRKRESQLEQEVIRRKSTDESTQTELKRCHEKMAKLVEKLRDAEGHSQELEERMVQVQRETQRKCAEMESELKDVQGACLEKEELMERERAELERAVQDLTSVARQSNMRVEELENILSEKEDLIRSQRLALKNKDEQMRLANQEVENVRKKSADLDKQVRNLRSSVEILEKSSAQDNTIADLQAMLDNARKALECEKDKLLIKDKIIEDHADTIRQLKMQLQDRGPTNKCQELEQQLTVERQRTNKLAHDLEECSWRRRELEKQLAQVEDELDHEDRAPDEQLSRHDHLLRQLEMQVEAKQKEWELQMKLMKKERDTALSAAKYASRKLDATIEEFKKKMAAHDRVQRIMNAVMKEKDDCLAEADRKVKEANSRVKQLSQVVCQLSCATKQPPLPPAPNDPECNCNEQRGRRASRRPQRRVSYREIPCPPCTPKNSGRWATNARQNYYTSYQ